MEYGEEWYETPKELKRTRSIRDNKILVKDYEREEKHGMGVDGLSASEV